MQHGIQVDDFTKLLMGLVVLVKMSVLINFLLQNTNPVSVLEAKFFQIAGQD